MGPGRQSLAAEQRQSRFAADVSLLRYHVRVRLGMLGAFTRNHRFVVGAVAFTLLMAAELAIALPLFTGRSDEAVNSSDRAAQAVASSATGDHDSSTQSGAVADRGREVLGKGPAGSRGPENRPSGALPFAGSEAAFYEQSAADSAPVDDVAPSVESPPVSYSDPSEGSTGTIPPASDGPLGPKRDAPKTAPPRRGPTPPATATAPPVALPPPPPPPPAAASASQAPPSTTTTTTAVPLPPPPTTTRPKSDCWWWWWWRCKSRHDDRRHDQDHRWRDDDDDDDDD